MREIYSKGGHANVYHISAQEKRLFPHAHLTRVDRRPDAVGHSEFLQRYYVSKIVNLLFPGHFIRIVGARKEKKSSWKRLFRQDASSHQYLYSDLASVPTEHAVFASHIDKIGISPQCDCPDCRRHIAFHRDNEVSCRAEALAESASRYGLVLPYLDPSDYCMDLSGDIIFFETEGLILNTLRETLMQDGDNPHRELCLRYLDRYAQASIPRSPAGNM